MIWLTTAWTYIKTNWKWFLAALVIVLMLAAGITGSVIAYGKVKNLMMMQSATNASYEQQIEVMKQVSEEEQRRRDELIFEYEKKIQEQEIAYQESQKELEIAKKKQVKNYNDIYKKDPGELGKIIEEQFGVSYVP